MRIRNIVALVVLCAILLAGGFLFTPLMAHIRYKSWDASVNVVAKIFRIQDTEVSKSTTDQLNALLLENVRLKSELSDYKRLRNQLGAPAFESFIQIYAHVVARPIDTMQSEYILNKGIAEGVSVGDPVLVQGSVLIGFIYELSQHTAIVRTLFHPETSITAATVGPDSDAIPAKGLITSQYQTSLTMNTIPRDSAIAKGQHVVTTSNGGQIPYGMVIGSIADISKLENEAYQQAAIEVPYNPDSIEAVTILSLP